MSKQPHEFVSPVWREGILKGTVVFVTGGAGDICSGQTRALVYLGADACIIGRNPDKTQRVARDIALVRQGARVIGIGNVDVRKYDDLKAAADRCAAELGGIDFVIAGAAGNFIAPIAGLSPNAFKTVMDIDTLGTYNTVKATIDYLVAAASKYSGDQTKPEGESPRGKFLAISATFHYTGYPLQAHAAAAKAAVDSIVASVALEYGPRGVMANVIAPGPIEGTEGMDRLASNDYKEQTAGRGSSLKLRPGMRGASPNIPSGRWGTVRDIADATVYLFSSTGDNVNGHVLIVDGGAWRRQGTGVGSGQVLDYPGYLLEDSASGKPREKKGSKL